MRFLLRLLLIILVPLAVSLLISKAMTLIFMTPISAEDTTPVFFEVLPGQSFRTIAKELEKRNLVRYWWSLDVLGRLRKGRGIINTGEYELSRKMNAIELLEKLFSGDTYKRKVTIKEGTSIWGIGQLFEEAGLISKSDFEKAIVDPVLIARANIQASSLEGYLFPDTYLFSRPVTAEQVIQTLLNEGNKNWTDDYIRRAASMNMSRHEVLTIASIIEKESGVVAEQPIIASVIQNRLKSGMKLQLDPTVIYGIPNFNGNLTKADLERPSPYNTYVNYGLPPGPIANPGKSAIHAALFPAETQFAYFVADGSGGHTFSITLAEHNDAVRRYQLK